MIKSKEELKDTLIDVFFEALNDMNDPYMPFKVDVENDPYWDFKIYELCADAIIDAGYGDVSEYKAEIERLKEEIKQAQIDVLNELKARHDYAMKNMGYPWDISQQIDELIKEVEK